jgi:hypothetical protein
VANSAILPGSMASSLLESLLASVSEVAEVMGDFSVLGFPSSSSVLYLNVEV